MAATPHALGRLISGRFRSADRLLRTSAGLLAVVLVWFVVNLLTPVGPSWLLWLPTPLSGILGTIMLWRTSRTEGLPLPTRRFWRHVALVAAFVTMGSTAQGIEVMALPDISGPRATTFMLLFDGIGVLLVVWALYRLPLRRQTFSELVRVVLDAGTVMLAAGAFMWHLQSRVRAADPDNAPITALVLTVAALVAVFAVMKVVFSSDPVVSAPAMRRLVVAILIGATLPMTRDVLEVFRPHLFPQMISVPAVFFFGAWAAERQRFAQVGPRRGVAEKPHRSFSVIPYIAVVAVDALLLYVIFVAPGDAPFLAVAAVLLTALVVLRQVTSFLDNARLLRRLDHAANHDALTDLPNREFFNKRLQKALTDPGDRPVSVALIDLDDFKEVNDTLGHEVGDVLLVNVASRLAACVRVEDTVARLGGDEFVVVLDNADPAAAALAAERMIDALRQPVFAGEHELPIRASIGIADGRTGDEAGVLLRHADIAMYAAKAIPGTAYLHYEDRMAATGNDHAHLGAELREAIRSGQLFLLYQPIVALDDGRVIGAEALVRWDHPVHGTLAPDSFIPVAERTGLIVPLGRWVLDSALREMSIWMARHGDDAPGVLNVNVSARDLREPAFAEVVAGLLAEHEVPADRITLEVTETMAVEPGQSVVNLQRLRALGVRISLDDFGTGHSALTLLHDCPVDEIKLDKSFTQAEVDGRVPVAAAVIHLAQALGLHAVAEGVETAEQAEQLLALGYIAAQGYHFARPMPADKFSDLLDEGSSLAPLQMSA